MGALTGQDAVIQHQDPVRVHNRGNPLGNNEGCGVIGKLPDGMTQPGVGGEVQGGGRVIQNQNGGLTDQSPGNGETLPLAAGKIATALFHRRVQLIRLVLDKIRSLGVGQGLPDVIVGSGRGSEMHVVPDGASEQESLLQDAGRLGTKI